MKITVEVILEREGKEGLRIAKMRVKKPRDIHYEIARQIVTAIPIIYDYFKEEGLLEEVDLDE